jgi:hypothetical protein
VAGVVAGLNLAAAARQRHTARVAADRVSASVLPAAGHAQDESFELNVLVDNAAGVLHLNGARLDPPVYDVSRLSTVILPAETTSDVTVQVAPHCPAAPEPAALRLVLTVTPASGRAREISLSQEPRLVAELARQACGFLSPAEAAQPQVVAVTSQSRYRVVFRLRLQNRSARPITLHDIVGVALSFGVQGGVPAVVPPHGAVDLEVEVSLPACGALPPAGEPGVPLYGSFSLELSDADGNAESLPYLTDNGNPLHPALVALRSRICRPGTYLSRPPG